jgi:hypothetical protein
MPTHPKHLRQMIADQNARAAAAAEARETARKLNSEEGTGKTILRDALIEASGYKVDQIVKSADGRELKIVHIRLDFDNTTLLASCRDRIKSGSWSAAPRLVVRLVNKALEPGSQDPMHPDNRGFDGPGGAE